MLRNQFRKQTKNTAKNLHLNYRALIVNICTFLLDHFTIWFFLKHLLQDLDPPFCIQNSGTDQERLPTASTCMNLLKLPDFRVKRKIFTYNGGHNTNLTVVSIKDASK